MIDQISWTTSGLLGVVGVSNRRLDNRSGRSLDMSALEDVSKPPAVGVVSMFTPVASVLALFLRSGLASPDFTFVAANFAVAADCACSNLLMVGCRSMSYLTFGFGGSRDLLLMQPMLAACRRDVPCTVEGRCDDSPRSRRRTPGCKSKAARGDGRKSHSGVSNPLAPRLLVGPTI